MWCSVVQYGALSHDDERTEYKIKDGPSLPFCTTKAPSSLYFNQPFATPSPVQPPPQQLLNASVVSRVCCSVVYCGTVWCSEVQCDAALNHTRVNKEKSSVVSVVQCGAAWCSVVRWGAAWCSVLQRGAV